MAHDRFVPGHCYAGSEQGEKIRFDSKRRMEQSSGLRTVGSNKIPHEGLKEKMEAGRQKTEVKSGERVSFKKTTLRMARHCAKVRRLRRNEEGETGGLFEGQ